MEKKSGKGNTEVGIRHYREGDEEQLNELFKLIFRAERSIEGWYWKFRDNPILDRILISVAVTEENRIVGMYPLLIMEYKVQDEYVISVQLVEISIHPDFRGGWAIKQLKAFLQPPTIASGARFGFGFPTREHAKVGLRYMGYNLLGELPILGVAPGLDIPAGGGLVRRCVRKVKRTVRRGRYLRRVRDWAGEERKGDRALELIEVDRFDGRVDRLWEEVSSDYAVIAHRSPRYLNWRYVDNPNAEFTILCVKEGEGISGYMVFTTVIEEGQKNGVIFDYFHRKSGSGDKLLLRQGIMRLLQAGARTIRCAALPHMPVHEYLVELGFEKWPTSPLVNFEVLDDSIDESVMRNLDQWYLCIGDTDLLGW